jgi:uncharacterized phiE125 gp8 family phage protein
MPIKQLQSSTTPAITLADAKQHLRVDVDDDDALIETLVSVVYQAAQERTERTLLQATWRLSLDAFTFTMLLPKPPCVSVQSVKYIDTNGTEQTLDPATYVLDTQSEPARLTPAPNCTWPATQARINAVWVDYTAGYGVEPASIPTPIVQWMKLAMSDLYDNRARSSDKPNVPQHFADSLLDPFIMVGC